MADVAFLPGFAFYATVFFVAVFLAACVAFFVLARLRGVAGPWARFLCEYLAAWRSEDRASWGA